MIDRPTNSQPAPTTLSAHAGTYESYSQISPILTHQRLTSSQNTPRERAWFACGPRSLLTGDRRHGRGCELRRCSGRLTSGPGAPNGASRHRAKQEILRLRLLFSRAARAGCHRFVSRSFRLHAAQASTSSARCHRDDRLSDHPTPPTHHVCAFVLGPSIYPHFPRSPRPGEPKTQLLSVSHPIPSPVTQSRKSSSSHARATLTFSAPPPCFSRALSSGFCRRCLSRAHPTLVPLGTSHRSLPAHVACNRLTDVNATNTGPLSYCTPHGVRMRS